jgi:penicillin-binding protein 1A
MKVAHQGVPVVDIPGLAGGVPGFSPSLSPGISPPIAPPPPATVALRPAPPGDPARREAGNGLDGWLLDRLFGRR